MSLSSYFRTLRYSHSSALMGCCGRWTNGIPNPAVILPGTEDYVRPSLLYGDWMTVESHSPGPVIAGLAPARHPQQAGGE